jgi:hypothetical protein
MATGKIQYAFDVSNTGPNEATRTRTEGVVTKDWPRVIPEDNRVRTGVYHIHSAELHAYSKLAPIGSGSSVRRWGTGC